MNFNALVNTQGIKGTRRGGNVAGLKEAASKAVGVTASVTKKTATTVVGWAPATNNKVNRVEYEALTRDREVIYEVRKNREAINEVRFALGLSPVEDSTAEEVMDAVVRMEEAAEAAIVPAPPNALLRKLQQALGVVDKNMPKAEEVVEVAEVAKETEWKACTSCGKDIAIDYQFDTCRKCRVTAKEVTPAVVVDVAVPTKGATRRFISSPDSSTYDYSDLSDQA
jgi:hypothetical protein